MKTEINSENQPGSNPENILCIARQQTGHALLQQLAHLGFAVSLLTTEDHREADWPHESLHEFHTMPGSLSQEQILNTVTYLARSRKFARILALDPQSLDTAAALREHLRIPGMGITTTHNFSDRLAMLAKAAHLGIHVPQFTSVLNYDDLRIFMEHVPAPWLLRSRHPSLHGNARTLHDSERLWRVLEELGDRQTDFLLEQSLPGQIFSVESILAEGKVIFSATQYHSEPDEEAITVRAVSRTSREDRELKNLNATLIPGLGLFRGISHAKFIRTRDARFSLLDVVPGIADALSAAVFAQTYGLNLWAQWAQLEVNALRSKPYTLPPTQPAYAAGILSRSPSPDLAQSNAAEIVQHLQTVQGTGLIFRAQDAATATRLLQQYRTGLSRDFSRDAL